MARVTRGRDGKSRPPAEIIPKSQGIRLIRVGDRLHMHGSYHGKRIRESTFETDVTRAEIVRALRVEELYQERIQLMRSRLAGIKDMPDADSSGIRAREHQVQLEQVAPELASEAPPLADGIMLEPVIPLLAPAAPPSISRTVEEAFLLYLGEHPELKGSKWLQPKKLSDKAIQDARKVLKGVRALDAERKAPALCLEVGDPYLEALAAVVMQNDVVPATVKRAVYTPARAVFRRAHKRWGVAQGCPVLVFTSIPDTKGRDICIPVYVAERMVAAALAAGDFLTWTVLQFGLCEGARVGEMFALEWADLDLARTCVTFYDVKSDRSRDGIRDRTLNDVRPRSIAALQRYRRETGGREGPVFLNHWDEPFSTSNTFDKRVNKGLRGFAKSVGYKLWEACTCHALRHTATSWHDLVDGSSAVKRRMDWKDTRSFERYCHPAAGTTAHDVWRFWGIGKNLTHSPGRTV